MCFEEDRRAQQDLCEPYGDDAGLSAGTYSGAKGAASGFAAGGSSRLNNAGVPAGVICAPVVPGITDGVRELDALVKATKEHGGTVHLCQSAVPEAVLSESVYAISGKRISAPGGEVSPALWEKAFVSEAYRKRISELMRSAREVWDWGLRPRYGDERVRSKAYSP